MLQHVYTVLTGALQPGTRLAVPHVSTLCKIPQTSTKVGGLRKCGGYWAHLVLQGLLQVGSPATHTGSWPWGAVGSCARGFSFSKAWHKEGLALGAWKHFQISLESILSFKASTFSCTGCDSFCSEDFPSETVFPVGQCPAACKLSLWEGRGETSTATTLLLSQLNSEQEQEAVITRIIILNCFEKTPTLVPKFYTFQ